MIDHLVIKSTEELHDATVAFYTAALEPLGYKVLATFLDGKVVGFGVTRPDFWIGADKDATTTGGTHFAFRSESGMSTRRIPRFLTMARVSDDKLC